MACVGGSVAVSGTLAAAPLMTTQAVRYALAVGLLLGIARLTGRRVPQAILDRADYVTIMQEVRHPYQQGIQARKGIEF